MPIELFLLGLLVGALAWFYRHHRARLQREVATALRQATWHDAQGHLVFQGAQATVLQEVRRHGGSDQTGPWVSACCLCHMPASGAFWVRIDTARGAQPLHCEVEPLSPLAWSCAVAMHPQWAALH